MYVFNSWPGNWKVHKASCPYGPREHSPVGEENPLNPYRLGPFGLQQAIDEAQARGRVLLCEHCFKREIAGTADD
jgi:hypothetical protein